MALTRLQLQEEDSMRKLKKSELKRVYGAKDGSAADDPPNPEDTDIGQSTGGDGQDS